MAGSSGRSLSQIWGKPAERGQSWTASQERRSQGHRVMGKSLVVKRGVGRGRAVVCTVLRNYFEGRQSQSLLVQRNLR